MILVVYVIFGLVEWCYSVVLFLLCYCVYCLFVLVLLFCSIEFDLCCFDCCLLLMGFAWFVGFDWYTVCFDLDWLFGLCIDLLFCFLVVLVCVLFVWLWCLVFAWAIYLWCFVGCGYLHPLFALLFASVYDCDCLADICLLFNRLLVLLFLSV